MTRKNTFEFKFSNVCLSVWLDYLESRARMKTHKSVFSLGIFNYPEWRTKIPYKRNGLSDNRQLRNRASQAFEFLIQNMSDASLTPSSLYTLSWRESSDSNMPKRKLTQPSIPTKAARSSLTNEDKRKLLQLIPKRRNKRHANKKHSNVSIQRAEKSNQFSHVVTKIRYV